MKAEKCVVQVAKTDGNSSTVEAQVYDGLLALWRFSKAFSLRPGPLDFQVSYVPDGMLVGYFKKQSTAKAYIEHLLAYCDDALWQPGAVRARALHPVWVGFYRRDFPAFPLPEEK